MIFSFFIILISSWSTQTHRNILQHAIMIIQKDQRPSYNFFVEQHPEELERLRIGAVDPDWEEKATGTHYYIYPGKGENTGQYYKNAFIAFSKSNARTRLEEHYQAAITYFCSGDFSNAFHQLGRSIHYLQDISCTAHSAGIQYRIIRTNVHAVYEDFADTLTSRPELVEVHASSATSTYQIFASQPIGIILNDLARLTSQYKDLVESNTETNFEVAVQNTVPLSEQYTAAFLDKFYLDTMKCGQRSNATVSAQPIPQELGIMPLK